jgi:predicted alpha/beta-hydrolase family hydrolase
MLRNHGTFTLRTPRGDARLSIDSPPGQTFGVALLFHGAGGGSNAPVLLAVRDALVGIGWRVARLDQPYVVAGRRAPAPAHHLDEVALLAAAEVSDGPLVLVGKSSGARVGCRTAVAAGARSVVALGFPLHPPGRPEKTRAPELNAAGVPVLALQGSRDAFGTPAEVAAVAGPHVVLSEVEGADHSLRTKAALAAAAERTAAFVQAST